MHDNGLTDAERSQLLALQYAIARRLPSGEVATLLRFFYTVGLLVGVDLRDGSYRTRFCYPDIASALEAFAAWDGAGDPPGNWIKQKGGVERCNPRFQGIAITVEGGQ